MNPIVASVLAGTLTLLGRWARGKGFDVTTVVGIGGIAIALSIIDQIDSKIARSFGVLVVLAIALAQFPYIAEKTGLGKQ